MSRFPHPAPRPPAGGRPGALRLGLPLADGMRVGLFGGTFNPAHAGHAHVALTAERRLGLDLMIWLVTPQSPLKNESISMAARQVSAARWTGGAMRVSDAEARLGSRYTIDTVRRFKARFPRVRFVWVMGSDNLADLARWRDWPGLMREVPMAVVARPGATITALTACAARRFAFARLPDRAGRRLPGHRPPAWIYLTGRWLDVSSTALREKADRAGEP